MEELEKLVKRKENVIEEEIKAHLFKTETGSKTEAQLKQRENFNGAVIVI